MLNHIIPLLSELIACPSITPHDADCQVILANRLEKLGFQCEFMPCQGVSNLWARRGNASPLFVFAGHTDVVPPGDETRWSHPPFSAEIQNGILYGRGASDMKGAIACMLVAIERFLSVHPDFPGSIALLITSDEEGDAEFGTKHVLSELKKRNIQMDYCLIGEASSEKKVGDQIRVGRRGSLHGHVVIHGKQGHVAYPEHVKNPIHCFSGALNALSKEVWDQGNAFFPPTTLQFTQIHSGTGALNVVPGRLEAHFNFRFGTSSSIDQLITRTTSILDAHHLTYDLEWRVGGEPFLSTQASFTHLTQQAIQYVTGYEPHRSTGGGTSDGRFIIHTGAELLELGVCHASAHQIDEHVPLHELDTLAQCYHQILMNLFTESIA